MLWGLLPVISQRFAVIGGQHDQRALEPPRALDLAQEPPDLRVDEGDLAVVALLRLRGLVGSVRVEVVHPQEQRGLARGGLAQPGQRGVGHLRGIALGREGFAAPRARVDAIVVDPESLIEPEPGIERERGDERRRAVAGAGQPLGEREVAGLEREVAVGPHPVSGRVEPCEQARVRGQGDRRGGERPIEANAARGQGVDLGRARRGVAVGADPIGARRVERDEDEVEPRAGQPAAAVDGEKRRDQDREPAGVGAHPREIIAPRAAGLPRRRRGAPPPTGGGASAGTVRARRAAR
jgi:hypothetical protein